MSDVGAVQIPLYNRSDPALWFVTCESNLPADTASLVRDILVHPDATDPYAQIKKRTHKSLRRIGLAGNTHKLLSWEELGSEKPSDFLRNMKRRTESLNSNDKLMMKLFLQRLLSSVQTILAAVPDLTLNKAADIVDRILEVSPSPIETFPVFNKK
ncbi:retrovirus-related Pol polyprotein from transposon opus [Trichonephila clavipes]|nr:retrovirus-related Pol polyprotein from transposon opus [Trichonephila clavipes]